MWVDDHDTDAKQVTVYSIYTRKVQVINIQQSVGVAVTGALHHREYLEAAFHSKKMERCAESATVTVELSEANMCAQSADKIWLDDTAQ